MGNIAVACMETTAVACRKDAIESTCENLFIVRSLGVICSSRAESHTLQYCRPRFHRELAVEAHTVWTLMLWHCYVLFCGISFDTP